MWQFIFDAFICQDARYKTLDKITINQFDFAVDITQKLPQYAINILPLPCNMQSIYLCDI